MPSVWWDREASGSAGGAGKAEGGQTACPRGSTMREGEKGGVLGALLKPQRCHMGGCALWILRLRPESGEQFKRQCQRGNRASGWGVEAGAA